MLLSYKKNSLSPFPVNTKLYICYYYKNIVWSLKFYIFSFSFQCYPAPRALCRQAPLPAYGTDGEKNMTSCADMGGCKKGCCTKTAQYFHLDQDQQIPQVDLNLPKCPSSFTVEPIWVYQPDIGNLRRDNCFSFIPPIVKPDISVLFQVFRC